MTLTVDGRDQPRPHVFCVNRSEAFLAVLEELLRGQEGYAVTTTVGVEAAFARVAAARPDAVVVDVVPGDAAAEALVRRLTTEAATRAVPVIVTSTDPRTVARLRSESASVRPRRYLVKPFDLEELLAAVVAVLRVG